MSRNLFRNIVAAFALFCALYGVSTTGAQTRRGTVAANKPVAAAKCSGAWTGIVTYTRTQTRSNSKTVERVSGRGKDTTESEMNFNYKAQVAVLESPEKNGTSIGKASINHSFTASEKVHAVEKNSCDRGKTWREMSGDSTSKTEITGSGATEANVNVGINSDGTYSVSVGVPQIEGKVSGSTTSSFSGQCTQKEGKNTTMPSSPTTIDGHSLTSDGTTRINENDPNRISGSYSVTYQDVTETITWSLQKCGAPLRLIDLKFEEMKFPNWNDWVEVVEQKGTTDGNFVKIKAKVLNASGEEKFADIKLKETYKGDKWDGARPDGLLENGEISVRLEPGEEKEVELIWDSSGYAWYDDGRPRLVQRIKAELEENGKKTDEMTKNLKVAPKPVILVHGLWSSWKAWETWQNILTTTHSYDWKAYAVGEVPSKGIMNTGGAFLSTDPTNTIFENSQQLGKYIKYAQEDRNAWHVDIVAHSMGGLISRHYIHHFMPAAEQDGRPKVSHLIMLGTPNVGSPCADVMDLAFDAIGKRVEAVRQLRQDVAEEFNRVVTNRKGVKFSVLAGNPLPNMCKQIVWNDGVVPVPSAVWKIKDNAQSKNIHTELTGTADFSSFVKPRLAIGPKGDRNPEPPDANQVGRFDRDRDVFFAPANFIVDRRRASNDAADLTKGITLAPKQSVDVEIPIDAALNFGITFMADTTVSATLLNPTGTIISKNLAKTPESAAWFRSFYIDKNVVHGTWKVRFENTSDAEREAILVMWKNAK